MGERYLVWDSVPPRENRPMPGPPDRVVAAVFADRETAAADATARNREWRPTVVRGNPNLFAGGPRRLTGMPELVFRDWLADADIAPPRPKRSWWERVRGMPPPVGELPAAAWNQWWQDAGSGRTWSDGQVARLTEALDHLSRFDVADVPADAVRDGETCFVVLIDIVDEMPNRGCRLIPLGPATTEAAARAAMMDLLRDAGPRYTMLRVSVD